MMLEDEELADRIAVGDDHQYQQDRVPQREAVERWRHPRGRVDRKRIAQRLAERSFAEMRADEDDDQKDR